VSDGHRLAADRFAVLANTFELEMFIAVREF